MIVLLVRRLKKRFRLLLCLTLLAVALLWLLPLGYARLAEADSMWRFAAEEEDPIPAPIRVQAPAAERGWRFFFAPPGE